MRIVHLSLSDVVGGAARGSYALHRELLKQGVDSWMLVEEKTVSDDRVLGDEGVVARNLRSARHRLDHLALRPYRGRDGSMFSVNLAPGTIASRTQALRPDIVHLHWVAASYVLPEDLRRFGVPIVWSLRDMWPFTGGCHVAYDCLRYQDACGMCPQLDSRREHDLSRLTWYRKNRAWQGVSLYPVGISDWIRQQAQSSSLFADREVRLIENAIDVNYWTSGSRDQARRQFDIPGNKSVLLFVSWFLDDRYKGFDAFRTACRSLNRSSPDRFHALVVGTAPKDGDTDLGVSSTFTGHLSNDDTIRLAYTAADATVLPSLGDSFGKAAAESMSCGTPCVVFDGTGLGTIVEHLVTGYVAPQGDIDDLVRGIQWVLTDTERLAALGQTGRAAAVQRFSVQTQASRYVDLYRQVLNSGQ